MNKTFSLSPEAIRLLDELVSIQLKETGKANKSAEVEVAIRERYNRRAKGAKRV